jgi:hypothetical protein
MNACGLTGNLRLVPVFTTEFEAAHDASHGYMIEPN